MKLLYISYPGDKSSVDSAPNCHIDPYDVLFIQKNEELLCLIITKHCTLNNWSEFGRIIEKTDFCFPFESKNMLLADFNGIVGRKGNKDYLNHLKKVFESTLINALIQNALDILNYRVDSWDAKVLMGLYHSGRCSSETLFSGPSSPEIPKLLFYQFMSMDLYELFQSSFKKSHSIELGFREVKQKYPKEFSKAIQAFKLKYPNNNIFDRVAKASPSNYDKIHPTIDEDIKLIYDYIVKLGYHQINKNDWVNEKGVILIINISPKI